MWISQQQEMPDLVSHYSSSPPAVNWLAISSRCPGPRRYLAQMSFELRLPVYSFLGQPDAKLAQCSVMNRQVRLRKFIAVAQERINRCLNVGPLFSFGGPTHCINATSHAMLYKQMNSKLIS